MAFSRIAYFFKRGLQLFRQNILINVMAVGTVALSFLIFSTFFLVYQNLNGFLHVWEKRIQVIVYLSDGLKEKAIKEIQQRFVRMPQVEDIHFVSQELAMGMLKKHLGDQDQVLRGLDANILPASFEIQLRSPYRNAKEIRKVASLLRNTDGVSDVQYGQQWIERFSAFMSLYRFSALLLALILSVAIAFIVSNAIRLCIYSRREELEIMKLVGATPNFIKVPFYIEGGLQGIIGSSVSLVILSLLYMLFLSELTIRLRFYGFFIEIHFLTPAVVLAIIGGGGLLGFVGSFLSLSRLKEQ